MENRRKLIWLALLGLAVAVVFGRVPSFGFTTFDDGLHIYDNPYLSPPSINHLLHFWKQPYKGLYIPLTYTSWSLETGLAHFLQGGGPVSPGFSTAATSSCTV